MRRFTRRCSRWWRGRARSANSLIRAHPDLVGRAALAGTLTRESTTEQRAAGLDPNVLSEEEIAWFQDTNAKYQAKFDFPFVICARDNQKDAIAAGLVERLGNDRRTEIETALHEIGRIAWHRLGDVVEDDLETPGADATGDNQYTFEVSYGKHGVSVYRVFATPLRDVAPFPSRRSPGATTICSPAKSTSRSSARSFSPPTRTATTRCSSPPTA